MTLYCPFPRTYLLHPRYETPEEPDHVQGRFYSSLIHYPLDGAIFLILLDRLFKDELSGFSADDPDKLVGPVSSSFLSSPNSPSDLFALLKFLRVEVSLAYYKLIAPSGRGSLFFFRKRAPL